MRRPKRFRRVSMICGRPMRIGMPVPSSKSTWAARSTRSSSPSAKMMRFFSAAFAALKTGFMMKPERQTKRFSWSK
ncbi:hypothetical protein D3C72_2044240 [compost metagenome]